MKTPMKVDFNDTVENWRLWGELVEMWSFDIHPKPEDATKLVNQMTAHGIKGASVKGPPDRKVEFYTYSDDAPLSIMLPSKEDLENGRQTAPSGQPYPLPIFYEATFNGVQKVFSADEVTLFAACRIGEYTINMCM